MPLGSVSDIQTPILFTVPDPEVIDGVVDEHTDKVFFLPAISVIDVPLQSMYV